MGLLPCAVKTLRTRVVTSRASCHARLRPDHGKSTPGRFYSCFGVTGTLYVNNDPLSVKFAGVVCMSLYVCIQYEPLYPTSAHGQNCSASHGTSTRSHHQSRVCMRA